MCDYTGKPTMVSNSTNIKLFSSWWLPSLVLVVSIDSGSKPTITQEVQPIGSQLESTSVF